MAENQQTTGGTKLYYSIIEGELRRKAKQEDNAEFIRKRTNKSGQELEEYAPGSISGLVKSLLINSKEFNGKKVTNLELLLSDVGENYLLQVPVESKYFASLVEKLPNIDFGQYVNVSVYDFTPTDSNKRRVGVTVKQNNVKLTSAFSKENPLPGVPDFPTNGDDDEKKLWGITRTKALKSLVAEQNNRLQEFLKGPAPESVVAEPAAEGSADDLPF